MKVLHVGHCPLPRADMFGKHTTKDALHPAKWVINLACAQKAHCEIQPTLLVKIPGADHDELCDIQGIPVLFKKVPRLLRGKSFFVLERRLLADVIRRSAPDIVHAHGTEESHALAALDSGLPCVLTIQGCFFIINRRLPAKFFSRQWIVERLEKRSIPKFKHIITKSDYIRAAIQNQFPGVTTHLIPNTYDPKLEEIPHDQPRENAIAFVGTMDPRKGLDIIADALEIMKANMGDEGRNGKVGGRWTTGQEFSRQDAGISIPTLHIFGNRGESASPYEVEVTKKLRNILGEKLVLHGLMNQIEMAKIIASCSALVAPSREEMFGNQVIEALIVGTHAIVTDETAIAENVRRFGNGTVVPQENAPALADAIASVLASRLSALDCSIIARERISSYMGPKVVAEMHLKLYEKILSS